MFTKNSTTPANERSAACLTCHNKDAKRALWAGSQHDAADIACNSCHKIHANSDKVLSKATQTDVCYTCHKEQRTQMNRPSHHPVPEGKMSCSDCHNPHGSAGPKLVKRDSINDTCYTCHAEKRGPFVHSHEPVTEDCSNCHNAHGTTVPAMLKARPPLLCQQCHTPHAQTGDGPIPGQLTSATRSQNSVTIWQGRSCLNCHTQVHGSNNPSTTNPTPQLLMR
jgi:DmsE family decaheme c-type cytochrome